MSTAGVRSGSRGHTALGVGVATGIRVVAVAATYLSGRVLANAVMRAVLGSRDVLDPAGEPAGALVVGLALVAVAPIVAGTLRSRIAALSLVAFASVAAVMLEGAAFAPTLSPPNRLPLGVSLQLGVAIATAAVVVLLSAQPFPAALPHPRSSSKVAAIRGGIGATLVYVVAYLVTGSINYALVTGPYYAAHAGGLTTPPPWTVLAVAVVEGLLLTVGTVPLAKALAGSRTSRALACGLVLWALGGLVPLLQAAALPDVLRAASGLEIFFQKVPLGIAVAWLLAHEGPACEPSPVIPRDASRSTGTGGQSA